MDNAQIEPNDSDAEAMTIPEATSVAPSSRRLLRPLAEIVTLLVMLYASMAFAADMLAVNDDSMRPNLSAGQQVIVNRLAYRFTPPQRGDVVAVRDPGNSGQLLARRVVGLPGEQLEVVGNQILVNGQTLIEGYLDPSSLQTRLGDRQITRRQFQLSDSEYFLMSDKRTVGIDSRDWGAIAPNRIEGRLGIVLWPPDTISLTRHVRYEELR